jgi:hypothetical protein
MGHVSFLMQLAQSNSTNSSKSLIPTMICNRFPIPICLHLSWNGRGFPNNVKGCQWTTIMNFSMPINSRSNNDNYINHQTMFPWHGALWLHVHQQQLQVHYKESSPYQPMYLWFLSKSTIFVTTNAITLHGTMVKTTCGYVTMTCNYIWFGWKWRWNMHSYHLQLMVFNIKWEIIFVINNVIIGDWTCGILCNLNYNYIHVNLCVNAYIN